MLLSSRLEIKTDSPGYPQKRPRVNLYLHKKDGKKVKDICQLLQRRGEIQAFQASPVP